MGRIVQIIGDGRPGGGTTIVLTLSRMLAARGNDIAIIAQTDSALVREAAAERLEVRGIDFSRRASAIASARLIDYHLRDRTDCTVFVSEGDFILAERHDLLTFSSAHKIINNAVAVDPRYVQTEKAYDIGFLGRLHYQKNPLILVEILRAMRPLRPSLCVIGGGELAPELEARLRAEGLREQVTLQGEHSRAEALRLAASCRLLLLPSRWEGHPLALIEAMHLGLPVVASDIAGNDEVVVDGETGYLVPVNNAEGYADRLKLLLSNPDLMFRMKCEAKKRIDQEYSLELMVESYLEVYSIEAAPPDPGV